MERRACSPPPRTPDSSTKRWAACTVTPSQLGIVAIRRWLGMRPMTGFGPTPLTQCTRRLHRRQWRSSRPRTPAPACPSSAGAPSVGASPRRRVPTRLADRPRGLPPRSRDRLEMAWTVRSRISRSLKLLTARIVGGRFDPAVPVNHSRGSGYGAAPTGSRATCPLPDALVEVRREVSAVHS